MSFLSFFGHFFHHYMVNYIVIILPGQGFISDPQGFLPNYIILAGFIILFTQGFFCFSILFRHANLSRVRKRNQHRSKLQTLVSSYHSKTSAQRSPSLAICTNSQDLSCFLESEHFSAKITRVPEKRNMRNMKNLTLSLLYNYSFPYSFFSPPNGI